MMNRYEVILAIPILRYDGEWTLVRVLVRVGRYKTKESAITRAVNVLAKHPTEETRAKREDRTYACEVWDRKKGGHRNLGSTVAVIEAPIHIVPSVGELGYTP